MPTNRIIILLFFFVCFLTSPQVVDAQQSSGASITERLPLRVPDVLADSLPSGLKLYFVRVNDLPLVEISFLVNAGISKDAYAKPGVSQMTNGMLMMGTKKRSRDAMLSDLNTLGSSVSNYVHYEYAQIYGRCLAKNFQQTFDIMADIITSPLMDERMFDFMKRDMNVSLANYSQSIAERSTMELLNLLYGAEHPIANGLVQPLLASDSVHLNDATKFYSDWYTPNNTSLVIVGDINPAIAKTLIAERLAQWTRAQNPVRTFQAPFVKHDTTTVVIDDPTEKMAWVRIGVRHAVERSSKDFYPLLLLNHILGQSTTSRLMKALWIDRAISPNFSSGISFFGDGGYVVISGATSPNYCDSVHVLTREIMTSLATKPVSKDELKGAQNDLYLEYITNFATNASVQILMKEMVVSHLPPHAMTDYIDGIMDVTPAEIQKIAGEIFNTAGLCEVYAGSSENILPALRRVQSQPIRVIQAGRAQE